MRQRPILPSALLLLSLLLICLAHWAWAANLSREQRTSEALANTRSAGTAVWLEAGTVRFLGILNRAATARRLGAAVLLHDSGAHADWHEVINPLRRHLAERGWDTLSIQTPVSDDPSDPVSAESLLASSQLRIRAAVAFLKAREVNQIVLVGHGMGARMTLGFATQSPDDIKAVVSIGVTVNPGDEQDPVSLAIKGADIPILDLYGSQDHEGVVDTAPLRRATAQRNNRERYRLVEVAGADHFFTGMQEELVHRVAAWLKQALMP